MACSRISSSLVLSFFLVAPVACSDTDEGAQANDGDAGDGDGMLVPGDGDGDAPDRDSATLGEVLDGRSFELESADGYAVVPDTTVTLSFQEKGLSFHAGCNGHFADVTFEEETLVTQGFGSTLIGCDMARSDQDAWLANFFSSSPSIAVDGDRVTFTDGEVTLVFLDDRIANPAPPLIGTVWEMNAFVDGEVAFGGGFEQSPTVVFNDDFTVEVFTGCNTGTGNFENDPSSINFSSISYTEAGCSDMAEVEAHIQKVFLQGEVTYEFDGPALKIDRGTIGIRANAQQ